MTGQDLEERSRSKQPIDNRRAFVRDREMLLRNYLGEFVAYANGKLLCHGGTCSKVVEEVQKGNYKEVYVERVTEEAFKEDEQIEIIDDPFCDFEGD